MNNKKVIIGSLIATSVMLAAMGCWFCWHCPSRIYPPESHGLFWRQLAWNGVGLAVFAGAWFGTGVLAAMARKDTSDIRLVGMCVNSRSGYDSVPPFPEYIENGDSI